MWLKKKTKEFWNSQQITKKNDVFSPEEVKKKMRVLDFLNSRKLIALFFMILK